MVNINYKNRFPYFWNIKAVLAKIKEASTSKYVVVPSNIIGKERYYSLPLNSKKNSEQLAIVLEKRYGEPYKVVTEYEFYEELFEVITKIRESD